MEEVIVSGYCRCIDGARTVLAESEDGTIYADCAYADCPHRQSCPIAAQFEALLRGIQTEN